MEKKKKVAKRKFSFEDDKSNKDIILWVFVNYS